jgi:hypothetical protein
VCERRARRRECGGGKLRSRNSYSLSPTERKEPEVCYVTAHLTDSWFERYSWISSRHHECMYQEQGVVYVRGYARSFTYIRRTFSRDDVQDQEAASGRSLRCPSNATLALDRSPGVETTVAQSTQPPLTYACPADDDERKRRWRVNKQQRG